MGQGQLRVIIYIKVVKVKYIMLNAKFHDHRTISSEGEEFIRFSPYMGMAAILVTYLDHLYMYKLSFPIPKEAPYERLLK